MLEESVNLSRVLEVLKAEKKLLGQRIIGISQPIDPKMEQVCLSGRHPPGAGSRRKTAAIAAASGVTTVLTMNRTIKKADYESGTSDEVETQARKGCLP